MPASQPRQVPPEALLAILESAPDALLGVDAAGAVDYANASAARLLGEPADAVLGRPLAALLAGEDGSALGLAELEAATAAGVAGAPAGVASAVVLRDGEPVHVEVRRTPLETTTGPWVLVSATDVSERVRSEQRVRAASRAYLALARVNEAIVRARSPEELFLEACRTAVEESGFLGAWIARRGEGWSVQTVARAGSLDEYVEALHVTTDPSRGPGQGPLARALRDSETSFTDDFLDVTEFGPWHELAARFGVRGLAALPLRRGGRTVAALTLWSGTPHVFDEQMRSLLVHVADNVSYALDVLDGRARLEQVAAQRSQLLRRLVVAQEGERARIAADVHDDSVQALAAMDLRLGLLMRRVREAAPELEPAVAQLQAMNASVTAGLRHLLFDLEPVAPGSDLVELLRDAAAHALEGTPTRFTVEVAGGGPVTGLGDEVVTKALRIAQEALTNVRKHARAGQVRILLTGDPGGIEVAVSDDGIGTDDVLRPRRGHRGVTTMQDRAAAGGGWLRVEPGRPGTTVRYWLPRSEPGVVLS